MPRTDPIASMLADMIRDSTHGSPWHTLAEATSDLTAKDLTFKPARVPVGWGQPHRNLQIIRRALGHLLCAEEYADALAPRTRMKVEGEWDAVTAKEASKTPDGLTGALDVCFRRLHARASKVTDAGLAETCAMWHGAPKMLVMMDGGVLHQAWHLGQVAMLVGMSHARKKAKIAKPEGHAPLAPKYPGERDRSDCHASSRIEACLRLLDMSFGESPWHSMALATKSLTRREVNWRPYEWDVLWYSIRDLMMHVAACKVMYANHGFGDRQLDWPDVAPLMGQMDWDKVGPKGLRRVLLLSQDYLRDLVSDATDEDLDRVNPMHHGQKLTGWQVVACMAQHDAWHGGQISILRDTHAALCEG